MRLIDGDALEKAIYEWMPKDQEKWMDSKIPPIENLVVSIMMTIQEQLTVDAEPVRHGKWVDAGRCLVCSCCGKAYTLAETNFCWQCGAKMEVDDETD